MDTQWLEEGYKPREDNCREPGAEVSVHTAKPGRRLGAGKETMPGVGLRHLASWAGTTGWGGAGGSSSWGTGGKSQREVAMAAGWPCPEQNAENAGSLPQHVPQRKQMPGEGAGAGRLPWPTPSHLLPSDRGSGPDMEEQKGPGL